MTPKLNLKRKIITLLLLLLSMIFIPLISVRGKKEIIYNQKIDDKKILSQESSTDFFKALDQSTNEIIKIPDKEFLCGVVASEMPALFEKEALKAQAVASYTYFCRERLQARKRKDPQKPYDFTIDTAKSQNYISKDDLKKRWGQNFTQNYNKIKTCVEEVFPEVIEDNGEPILAAYHAISSGTTEKCEDVFGGQLNYLTNVDSNSDKLVAGYETKVEISANDFKNRLNRYYNDCSFAENPSEWVKSPTRTNGGMVKEINICSKNISGSKVRNIFDLRSSDFKVDYIPEEEKFIFTVHGYGHGVGMSQHGAQNMAKQGSNYKEILSWYYPNTSLKKLR